MLLAQILTVILIAGIILSLYFFLKVKKINLSRFQLILSSALAIIFFFRFMLGRMAIKDIIALSTTAVSGEFLSFMSLALNWMLISVVLLVVLYPFFKSSKMTVLIKYYSLIVALLSLGFIVPLTQGVVGAEAYSVFSLRSLLLAFELGIIISYAFIVFLENGLFKVKKQDCKAFLYIIPAILAVIPTYALQGLFGLYPSGIKLKDFSSLHRIILYISILLPIGIYFVMRKKDLRQIKLVLLFYALGGLLNFSEAHTFLDFMNVNSLPIHLCHTAMYIVPLCLIFKLEKVFYFTYFINVFGAFIALTIPNYSDASNLFSASILEFSVNHFQAFFMPILMVMLGLYNRPKFKHFKYSMIGFALYFVFVVICNSWFSNYGTVDYFFTNSNFVAEKLGKWAEDLLNITASFSIGDYLHFVFYPVYQILFFLTYVGIGAMVWFLYEAMYNLEDLLVEMSGKKRKIKADALALSVALAGRPKGEPMNKDAGISLVIKDFSKRYGKSEVYAVKDANLDIHAGEIFGFLGHNGAGKSTIIKSVVGIQPITSGSIEVCGYDVEKQPMQAKMQIGFVPDSYALYEKLTGRQYINYIADLFDVNLEMRNNLIKKYVNLFELTDAFDNQIKTYSHGMKQKITILSALVHNPKIWILDEPLTGLDPHSIFQVKECMKQHAKEGNIVFFSSHIIDVVENVCDRIAIIKRGKILTSESVKEILKKGSLEDFYLKTTNTKVRVSVVKEDKEANTKNKKVLKKQVPKNKKLKETK